MINLLHLDNFYLVMSYRRDQEGSDELSYTVRSLVMVRNRLPAPIGQGLLHVLRSESSCEIIRELFASFIWFIRVSVVEKYLLLINTCARGSYETLRLIVLFNF